MRRCIAGLALLIVLFQFFCFSISAEETTPDPGTLVESSYLYTTIEQDLRDVDLAAKYPLISGVGDKDVRLITAVVQELETSGVGVYLYFYLPGGTADCVGAHISFWFKSGSATLGSRIVDTTDTILKVQCNLTNSMYEANLTGDTYKFDVSLIHLAYREAGEIVTRRYEVISEDVVGGIVRGSVSLRIGADGHPTAYILDESLQLDVRLASERYSTEDPNVYTQLNTAFFLIPTEYFDLYGKLSTIMYQYALYERVPMIVSEGAYTFDPEIVNVGTYRVDNTLLDLGVYPFYLYPSFDQVPFMDFIFHVEQIQELEGSHFDVSTDELLAAYQSAKTRHAQLVSDLPKLAPTFDKYIKAGSYTPLDTYLRNGDEVIETESYANSTSWWQKLFDGRFGKDHDDSVLVPQIQTATFAAHYAKDTDALKEEFAIDDEGVKILREMLGTLAGVTNQVTLVVFHYVETEYEVHAIDGYERRDGAVYPLDNDNYIAFNAIIDQFKVIELYFRDNDQITAIPTVMPTMTYIGGLESDDKLEDEVFDSPIEMGKDALKKGKDLWEKLKRIVQVILFALIVIIVVIVVLKLIGLLRGAFGPRGGDRGSRGGGKGGG